jgi:hypothetical protein
MKPFLKYIFLALICIVFSLHIQAQSNKVISGTFNGKFEVFAQQVEQQTGYRFYFDPVQLDSFYVNITVDKKPLSEILPIIFQRSEFHYAIDAQNKVFITKNIVIADQLPKDFFTAVPNRVDTVLQNTPTGTFATRGAPTKTKLLSAEENKLYAIGDPSSNKTGNATITGYIRDAKNGEPLFGVSIYNEGTRTGATTDQFGYYTLTLPKGRHTLSINSLGMTNTRRQLVLNADGKLNITLYEFVPTLKNVTVNTQRSSNVRSTVMGVQKLDIKSIRQVTALLGEADVLRVVMALPGVTSVGESSTGLNVRGGSADQNLILFSNATVYNPAHFFGFFSAFNPDVIKDVELYKSSMPEKYGGRLSSVLDISTREGNKKKLSGSGGIGPLTSRLTLEGPIDSGRTSFLIGGRSTYSDWILKNISKGKYKNSQASFYDGDLHLSHEIDSKNNLYLTAYISNDKFSLNSDTTYNYSNRNFNGKWKHIFNNKLVSVLTAGTDHYEYNIASDGNLVNAYKFGFEIDQAQLRADITYAINAKHTINTGFSSIYYKFNPGTRAPGSPQSLLIWKGVPAEKALESAIYFGDQFTVSPTFSFNAGVRLSMYNAIGEKTVYGYGEGLSREVNTIKDSVHYANGKLYKTYATPEIRLSARYSLSPSASLKFSFNTLSQYIHMLSNTTAISPTDIWKLSDSYIKPQRGQQVSVGLYKNFNQNVVETSVELYYKTMTNVLDYKSGAQLILNPHIETDIINAKGKAYGAEFMLKKTAGRLNGWVSYTYSRTFLKSDDQLLKDPINNGKFYPADYDKPHNMNFIGNYKFSHRVSISLNVIYSTGRPITLPVAQYYLAGSYRAYYSERNEYRIPDYFRTDISMNIEGNHKIKKLAHSSITFGVFNASSRKNPYSVYFTSENGYINGYKLSVFGSAIPFITYNFKF